MKNFAKKRRWWGQKRKRASSRCEKNTRKGGGSVEKL